MSEERLFLEEAIKCYSISAFRAAIVMAWNLAYDHFQRWILSDRNRLDQFNQSMVKKFPRNAAPVSDIDSFSNIKEFDAVETAQHATLISKNVADIMKDKLKRRNAAAHPSTVTITQAQADDVITDLVNNVVFKLII